MQTEVAPMFSEIKFELFIRISVKYFQINVNGTMTEHLMGWTKSGNELHWAIIPK